jgi:hypothetical protein
MRELGKIADDVTDDVTDAVTKTARNNVVKCLPPLFCFFNSRHPSGLH